MRQRNPRDAPQFGAVASGAAGSQQPQGRRGVPAGWLTRRTALLSPAPTPPSESMHDIGVAPVAKENKCNPPDTR
jgi:hypothetical protein